MPSRSLVLFALLASLCIPVTAGAQRRAAPDPIALARQGSEALGTGRFADALEAFAAASALVPRDASLRAAAGIAAMNLGRDRDARRWLEGALELDPRRLSASVWLGELHYRAGRTREAIAVYEAALRHAPGNRELETRLAEWRGEAADRAYKASSLHFTVRFDGPADELGARRVVDRLEVAYQRVGQSLGVYPAERITVVLYTLEQFRDTGVSEWTIAAYDGRIHLPMRGAPLESARLDQVLTHELVHAVVHSLGGRQVPAWLNEGLASVLERGGAEEAEAVLARATALPRLGELHEGFMRLDRREASLAYATSTRAVGRLIRQRGASAVVALLRDLARGTAFDTAFSRRMAMRYEDFQSSMAR